MMSAILTDHDALALAKAFRGASGTLGDYLYDNWAAIDPAERSTLQTMEISLLNIASDLTTQAVGIILDDAQASLAALVAATGEAQAALKKITDGKKALVIITALIALAAAIPAGQAGAVLAALKKLRAATAAPPEQAAKPVPAAAPATLRKAAAPSAPPASKPAATAAPASARKEAPVVKGKA